MTTVTLLACHDNNSLQLLCSMALPAPLLNQFELALQRCTDTQITV